MIAPAPDPGQSERDQIAQVLHDTICQTLAGSYLQAALLVRKRQADQTLSLKELQALRDSLHRAVGELHQLAHTLRAPEKAP